MTPRIFADRLRSLAQTPDCPPQEVRRLLRAAGHMDHGGGSTNAAEWTRQLRTWGATRRTGGRDIAAQEAERLALDLEEGRA